MAEIKQLELGKTYYRLRCDDGQISFEAVKIIKSEFSEKGFKYGTSANSGCYYDHKELFLTKEELKLELLKQLTFL